MTVYFFIFVLVVLLSSGIVEGKSRYKQNHGRMRHFHKVPHPCHSRPPVCVNGTKPQLPSYISPMEINPYKMLGKWYHYAVWNGYGNSTVNEIAYNIVVYYTRLSDITLDPGTDTPALLIEDLESGIPYPTQTCVQQTALTYLTTEGQIKGLLFGLPPAEGTFYGIFTTLILETDYDSYAVMYDCYRVSNTTYKVCEEADVYVLTRDRPDAVLPDLVTKIAMAINRLLKPYCIDASMFFTRKWYQLLDECPVYRPSGKCYTANRAAMLSMAG